MAVNVADIKKLREQTGAGIADCREALEDSVGDFEKAKKFLKEKGIDKASAKSDREVKAGVVETYSHNGKIGVLVEVLCETDFVAKTDDFKNLAHDISLQVASMNPESVKDLLQQDFIKDPSLKINDLIKSVIAKLGENIQVGRFERIALGE